MRTIKVGRSNECDIILTYDKISRLHAEITFNGGQYIYHDLSKNGSNIGGRIVIGEKTIVAPGAIILLANKVPLPWEQVYAILNPSGRNVNEAGTVVGGGSCQPQISVHHNYNVPINNNHGNNEDELAVGWGILAFIIPIAGWIMYFSWKDETPKRARLAGTLATISFVVNIINLLAMFA